MHGLVIGPSGRELRLPREPSSGAMPTTASSIRPDFAVEDVTTTAWRGKVDEVASRSWGACEQGWGRRGAFGFGGWRGNPPAEIWENELSAGIETLAPTRGTTRTSYAYASRSETSSGSVEAWVDPASVPSPRAALAASLTVPAERWRSSLGATARLSPTARLSGRSLWAAAS